jgi:hypothetical protein
MSFPDAGHFTPVYIVIVLALAVWAVYSFGRALKRRRR